MFLDIPAQHLALIVDIRDVIFGNMSLEADLGYVFQQLPQV
jgi:hypothetical protein